MKMYGIVEGYEYDREEFWAIIFEDHDEAVLAVEQYIEICTEDYKRVESGQYWGEEHHTDRWEYSDQYIYIMELEIVHKKK